MTKAKRPDLWLHMLAQFIDGQVYDAVRACREKANKTGDIPSEVA